MRVDSLLVQRGLCSTRQEAQEAITKGSVRVNGQVVLKQSKNIDENAVIDLSWNRTYVSRGGDKLEGIFLDIFNNKEEIKGFLSSKSALDVGSSTGGFTDFLLQNGARNVTCVDVGTAQLHQKIAKDNRVQIFENTDIRDFPNDHTYDVIVGDLSFISLDKILDIVISFGASDSYFFLLIKPQFEVGKGNTKKGIVKDTNLVKDVLANYVEAVTRKDCKEVAVHPCRVIGGDGNQEYFLTFRLP